jgi:hypothetical protein
VVVRMSAVHVRCKVTAIWLIAIMSFAQVCCTWQAQQVATKQTEQLRQLCCSCGMWFAE